MLYFLESIEYDQFEHKEMSKEEFLFISKELEVYHSIFSELWNMLSPIMTNNINGRKVETAEVHFNEDNTALRIYINPNLWNRLNNNQKLFVLCHECMHVVFNYYYRTKFLIYKNYANIAADVSINQILINNFFFIRNNIDPFNELCWHDNGQFENMKNVREEETLEYYYNLLTEDSIEFNNNKFFIGNHSGTSGSFDDIMKNINKSLSFEEKDSIKEMIEKHLINNKEILNFESSEQGTSSGNIWTFATSEIVSPKKKWETVIKKWYNNQLKEDEKDMEQWIFLNRRFRLLNDDLFLPSEIELDEKSIEKKKIKVWFFQDTSGSCSGYVNRFFKAALSLPKKRFDVKMHCFDTKVYETTLESRKLYGFGGTSFHIIENYILQNSKDYPKAVFIITDGYGTKVIPKFPKNWYVFLTPGGNCSCFPTTVNMFNLENFE